MRKKTSRSKPETGNSSPKVGYVSERCGSEDFIVEWKEFDGETLAALARALGRIAAHRTFKRLLASADHDFRDIEEAENGNLT